MGEPGGPPKLTIDSACDATDPQTSRAADNNFEFAFNLSTFSDRVLYLEVIEKPLDARSSQRKHRRADDTKEKDVRLALEYAKCSSKLASNCEPKIHDCEEYENHNEDDVSAPHELTPSALQTVVDSENKDSSSMSSPCILRVRPIHINFAILSAKSPFFYKLVSNGMKESERQDLVLRINESEDKQSSFSCFGIGLVMIENSSICCTVDFEVAARTMQLGGEFVIINKKSTTS